MTEIKIAILVNSCDAYSDLWPYFFKFLKENIDNTDLYNIYLNTESKTEIDAVLPVTIINTKQDGKDKWGKRLINSLSKIKEDYVVVLMDDFFLKKPMPSQDLLELISIMKMEDRIATIYLSNVFSQIFTESKYTHLVEVPKKSNYRLNSAPALWRKTKLLSYIRETDNPWAWEYFGTCRTNYTDDIFLCTPKEQPIYDYAHAIYRGKWLGKDINPLVEKFNINIDTSVRGVVLETDSLPKRSFKWKIQFILEGIKMVGFDAIKEVLRDKKNAIK